MISIPLPHEWVVMESVDRKGNTQYRFADFMITKIKNIFGSTAFMANDKVEKNNIQTHSYALAEWLYEQLGYVYTLRLKYEPVTGDDIDDDIVMFREYSSWIIMVKTLETLVLLKVLLVDNIINDETIREYL